MFRLATTNGIPRLVLAGRIPRWKSVNEVFLTTVIQGWYRRAWRSYLMRSELGGEPNMDPKGEPVIGEEDDYERSWHQLKPDTYRIKASLQADGTYTEYLSRVKSAGAKAALKRIEQMNYEKGQGTNIRTGRLLAAFAPPYKSGKKLIAGPDQSIKIDGNNSISMDVKNIDYADEILYGTKFKRALYDNGVENEWLQEAIQDGLKAAKVEYDRLASRFGPFLEKKNK